MDNPGPIPLTFQGGAFQLGSPGTFIGDEIDNLEGMKSLSVGANFTYGAGGTSVTFYLQTTLDQGNTWMDITALRFTNGSLAQAVNLDDSAQTTPVTPNYLALTPGTVQNGFLGASLRPVVVVAGSGYSGNTALALGAVAR